MSGRATPGVPLLDAAGARAGDVAAVSAGSTWAGLMDRAAGHLARGVVRHAGHGYGLRVAVVVGKGNNGGDGWGAARRLVDLGAEPWVVSVPALDGEVSEESAANRAAWLAAGGRVSMGLGDLKRALDWADVAVDALLGTGVTGGPHGDVGAACERLLVAADGGTAIVACDLPSGVSSDDGSAPPGAVRADVTVTFGAWKRGLLLHPGAAHAGRVEVGDLGPQWRAPETSWRALTAADAAPTELDPGAEKRARGVLLIVAGSSGKAGAAALCGAGALTAGGGLVTVATPGPVRAEVAGFEPGLMTVALPDADGAVSPTATTQLASLAAQADVVVAGPGLGIGHGATMVVESFLHSAERLVLDADALNIHRDDPVALGEHHGDLVLTPHERELARITGLASGPEAWARRVAIVPTLARDLRATIVAKGPATIVAGPDGRVWVTPTGGPALGSGGTGDLLSGMIGAAIAKTSDVPLAVARAVWWHGLAGELAGRARANRATAVDVLHAVPLALGRAVELSESAPGWPLSHGPRQRS